MTYMRTRICAREKQSFESFVYFVYFVYNQDSKAIDDMLTRLGWYPTGRRQKFGAEYDIQREYVRN